VKRIWNAFLGLWPADPRVRRHAFALVLVLVAAMGVRAADVRASLPYPRHLDETTWANIALRILRTGDWNPHRFRKPSLPVYLMVGGFSVGLVRAELAGEATSARDLGTSASNYYLVPSSAEIPKDLFALASVLALGLAGVIGYRMTKEPAVLWLTPLLASASASFYRFSWSYMNVDIIGAFFALLTVAYLVKQAVREVPEGSERGGYRVAVTSGILAGLTVGSKYNLFPVLVPCVLWFFFYDRRSFISFVLRCTVVGATSFATFLATTPYAVLDFRSFYFDLMKEAHHYATGHPGATVKAGLPMFATYLEHFWENFGAFPFLLALVGAGLLIRRDYRLAIVAYSYPVVFVAYMSMQSVFFERNVVAAHLFVALSLASAIVLGPGLVSRAVSRRRPSLSEPRVFLATRVAVVVLVLLGLPWGRTASAYSSGRDPRNQAAEWVLENVPKGATVLVDRDLEMDARSLRSRYAVFETDVRKGQEQIAKLTEDKKTHVVVLSREGDRGKYSKLISGDKARARFARAADKLGASEARPLTILERPRR
jgi:hypothetical protein